ncbi:MAG TPA: hypothetical protein VHX66_17200 [Solirubrobacteraceae bacterium]|jgi:hypothetical protein|nr:hypothetical protein [Solirubrobacteraceae bacterium]
MRRALTLAVLAAAIAATAAASAAAPGARVHVVRCQTTFGLGGKHNAPATVEVRASAKEAGLVAYTNTETFLLGPPGLRCNGLVAVDGGTQIIAWRSGKQPPAMHGRIAGLTLEIETACSACRADAACPFFPAVASSLGFACTDAIPARETTTRPSSNVVLFSDPPHFAGSGWPSGGDYTARGVVGTAGSVRNGLVYRATCTLPPSDRAQCAQVTGDAIKRYG